MRVAILSRVAPIRLGIAPRSVAAALVTSAPLSLVAAACGFNLWNLNAEATKVQPLNDSALHLAMLRLARYTIDNGRLPIDPWFPFTGLGAPQFHRYQSFPHIVGALASFIGGVDTTYNWSLYLLLALWPISIYLSARLLGWDRWTAGVAALISPLLVSAPGYGYEHSSYIWAGYGMWTQLWGMWLLPISLGLSWRAINRNGSVALAALVLALTIVSHFLTGYLAGLALFLWLIVRWRSFLPRALRAAAIGAGGLLLSFWAFAPVLNDFRWAPGGQYYAGTFWRDSYGAAKVMGWLIHGEIYDSGRLPIVSVFVAVGLVVALVRSRKDDRSRALIALFALSLLLFFGRPTLGRLVDLLPFNSSLLLHRYIIGIHLAGIFLAGSGLTYLWRNLASLLSKKAPARWRDSGQVAMALGAVVAMLAALYPAWTQIANYDGRSSELIGIQRQYESTDGADLSRLVDVIRSSPPGRVYAGTTTNWGKDFRVGYVPVSAALENYQLDGIGYFLRDASISSDLEVWFNETQPLQYQLFGIRYMLLPADRQPPVPATMLSGRGHYTLWQVAGVSGYLQVVDTVNPPLVPRRDLFGQDVATFLTSAELAAQHYPTVALGDIAAASPSLRDPAAASGPAGTVELESSSPIDGEFSGIVDASRPAAVLLKSSWDPAWHATVDGVATPVDLVAPSLVAVKVPAGRHNVGFRYVPFGFYPELLLLAGLTLLNLVLIPRFGNRLAAATGRAIAAALSSGARHQ